MKKFGVKIIFTIIFTLFSISKVNAVQFDVLVLPTDIFNVCDNYFCFPEPSEIAAKYVIEDLKGVTSGVPPVIGPTPNLIGCLEAFEAYKILTGVGKVTVAPKILTFDLLDLASFNMEEI
jgi:molybdopterin/thiamine biosynthesis adenylyltransferase